MGTILDNKMPSKSMVGYNSSLGVLEGNVIITDRFGIIQGSLV